MKRRHLYLTALAAALLVFQSCQKEVTSLEEKPEPNPVTKVDPPAGNVNFTVKQKNVAVADAKIRWFYTENGTAKKDSVVTNNSGIANASIPVNIATKLEIISHCGIMLYERGFGPFAQGQTVDTTIAVMANTLTCETTPPDQYFNFRLNGVHYWLKTPGDQIGFYSDPWGYMGQYFAQTPDLSLRVLMDCMNPSWINQMGIFVGGEVYGTTPYTMHSPSNGYWVSDFVLDLSHLTPASMDPDTEYKIPGKFRMKLGVIEPSGAPMSSK